MGPITQFIERHYHHFNSASLKEAARSYSDHIRSGKKMLITLAGAMSTAELGRSLAVMIREKKVSALSVTGANLEEDLYNLVAHKSYKRIPNWRNLSTDEEVQLLDSGYNRVTDTCIPEEEAFRKIEKHMLRMWKQAEEDDVTYFPHEYFLRLIREGVLESEYEIDPKDSWLAAAAEVNLPLFVPGWEDSTMGNIFAARCLEGKVKPSVMGSGIGYMQEMVKWYREGCGSDGIGFFQIGGGIAGDFPICVVPLLNQDMLLGLPKWSYFCQIGDSTTSYGSYSGAFPNEKISWGKLDAKTPKFMIESDATIVAPLIFAYVLGW